MNIETLVVVLVLSLFAAILSRVFNGFTLAGFLTSFLFACLGGVGGWLAQHRFDLPPLFTPRLWAQAEEVSVVWPGIAALLGALLGGFFWRPRQPTRYRRRRGPTK